MSEPIVTVERRDNGVAVVRLCNGKVNSLSSAVLAELRSIAHALTVDPPGAVVVAGSDRIFAAGADISEFGGPDEARAIAGPALGGGCELALACDLRVCSTAAKFGQPEILLGIIPGGGGTQRLARLVGPARAKDLILSGRQVRAEEALRIGLVDEVVEPEELELRAMELAASFAAGPLAAHAIAKRVIDAGLDLSLAEGLELEQDGFVEVFATDDARLGVASFLENGPGRASFTGR